MAAKKGDGRRGSGPLSIVPPLDDPEEQPSGERSFVAAVEGTDASSELTRHLQVALSDDHPLAFLALVSSLASSIESRDPASAALPRRSVQAGSRVPEMLSRFIDVGQLPTQAAAYALSRLVGDDLLRFRVDRKLGAAAGQLPQWLRGLDEARPTEALQAMDPVRAGCNIAVGVRLASGDDLTVVGFVDFDLGSPLTDAFVLDTSIAEYADVWSRLGGSAFQTSIELADARARMTAGIAINDRTLPPYESEAWPQCRAIVDWVMRMLPLGGDDFELREVSRSQESEIVDDFLRSSWAARLAADDDTGRLVGSVIGYRRGHNDPLLWSGKAVELFLCSYAPRKIIAKPAMLIKLPDVLAAFIQYAHQLRSVEQELTDEALYVISECTPEFIRLLEDSTQADPFGSEPPPPTALQAALDAIDAQWGPVESGRRIAWQQRMLAEKVGGPDAIERLDLSPLPDEHLCLEGIPDDLQESVRQASGLIDLACDELLDVEMRTVARRILHRVAATDPSIFRRGRIGTAAAAVAWIALINNNPLPGMASTQVPVKDLLARFGTRSASQRAQPMLVALGLPTGTSSPFDLGDVKYLTSRTRRGILQQWDLLTGH